MLRSIISSRHAGGKCEGLHKSDFSFLFDCAAHHNLQVLQRLFVDDEGELIKEKHTKQLYLSIDKQSIRNRKGCVRNGAPFDQIEFINLVTAREFTTGVQIPYVQGLHFKGSNSGNKIGDLSLPAISSLWALPNKTKIELCGKYRMAVGGQAVGEVGEGRSSKKKKDPEAEEPVFWHAREPKLWAEMCKRYCLKAVIDMGASDGSFAHFCATSKPPIPYLGFTLSDKHTELLKAHLVNKIMTSMTAEGATIYDPEFAKLLGRQPAKPAETTKAETTGQATGEPDSKKAKSETKTESASALLDNFTKKLDEIKKKRERNSGDSLDAGADEEGDSPDE